MVSPTHPIVSSLTPISCAPPFVTNFVSYCSPLMYKMFRIDTTRLSLGHEITSTHFFSHSQT